MNAKSNGDPVEIKGERDSLTISCEISECTHATTHTMDVPMRNAHPRQEGFRFIARFSISGDYTKEAVNWHMNLSIFV
jgi:hypothetical protein